MEEETSADLTIEGLVHDLNNVFDTISGAAELLEADKKWSRVARAILRSVAYHVPRRYVQQMEGLA